MVAESERQTQSKRRPRFIPPGDGRIKKPLILTNSTVIIIIIMILFL